MDVQLNVQLNAQGLQSQPVQSVRIIIGVPEAIKRGEGFATVRFPFLRIIESYPKRAAEAALF